MTARLFGTVVAVAALLTVSATATAAELPETNTTCPVMKGNPVNKDIFVDYQGRRVYFCCERCKVDFQATPTKYLASLPQFNAQARDAAPDEQPIGAKAARFIEPMGICTLVLVAVTVAMGLLRKKVPGLIVWHKRLGPIVLISALVHATLVMVSH